MDQHCQTLAASASDTLSGLEQSSLPNGLVVRRENPYVEAEAEDVDAFLSALSPISGFGCKYPFRTLIYRGHRDSTWHLVPTSRRELRKSPWPQMGAFKPDTWSSRLVTEAEQLLSFCRIADRRGLTIPNMMLLPWQLLDKIGAFARRDQLAIQTWPPDEAVPVLSLAQHCGMHTCLLDFSWNPYVAAYFAARDVMEMETFPAETNFLCVWVIDDGNLTLSHSSQRHSAELIVPPAADNRNLQAQEGLFMWTPLRMDSIPNLNSEYEPLPPLDAILSEPDSGCSLYKILLKAAHAPLLLHKLIKLGYDCAHLFPSYEGAARSVKEYAWSGIGHR